MPNILKEALSKSQLDFIQPGLEAAKKRDNVSFGKEETIRFPLDQKATAAPIPSKVASHLNEHGFVIPDSASYLSGHAVRTSDGRIHGIGKVLSKTKASPDIVQTFVNDPHRSARNNSDLHVVITRNPYHVAGMSTDRGWSSCMDLGKNGFNKSFINADLEHGTHVAYLTHAKDEKIENPIARIAIKPYKSKEGHVILRPESKTYGAQNSAFEENVHHFCETHFPMVHESYHAHSELYDDSDIPFGRMSKTKAKDIDWGSELNDVPSLMRSKDHRKQIFDNFHKLSLVEKQEVVDHLNEHGASDHEAAIAIEHQPEHEMKLSHRIVFRPSVPIETQLDMIHDPKKVNVNGIRDNREIHPEVVEGIMKHKIESGTSRYSVIHVPEGVDKGLTKEFIKKFPRSGSTFHNLDRKDLDDVGESVLNFPAATVDDFKSGKYKAATQGISSPQVIDHILKHEPRYSFLVKPSVMSSSQAHMAHSLDNVGMTSSLFDYSKLPSKEAKDHYKTVYGMHLSNMDLGKRKANQFFDIAEKDKDHNLMSFIYDHISEHYPLEEADHFHYQNRIQKVRA